MPDEKQILPTEPSDSMRDAKDYSEYTENIMDSADTETVESEGFLETVENTEYSATTKPGEANKPTGPAGPTEPPESEEKHIPLLQRINIKETWPYFVFGGLIFILLLSSALSRRPPEISSTSPVIAVPDQEYVIYGNSFGSERSGGNVVVAGISPPSSAYQEWSDKRIIFIVPDAMKEGLLKVVTKHGESREIIPFLSKQLLPVRASGPSSAGVPYIQNFSPNQGAIGTLLTITGINFGLDKGNADVYFSWISDQSALIGQQAETFNMQKASEIDKDYLAWDDREIKIYVPDGASSGNVKIITDKGSSNNVYFEVKDQIGKKLYSNKKIYHVQYGVEVRAILAEPQNGLYLWLPRILELAEQRDIKVINQEPDAMYQNYLGMSLYNLEELKEGTMQRINVSYMLSRYEVESRIDNVNNIAGYNTDKNLYKTYTANEESIPAGNKQIVTLVNSLIGKERNPYRQALRIYSYLLDNMQISVQEVTRKTAGEEIALAALAGKTGNPYSLALLFSALTRAAGIPSRPIEGYLVDNNNRAYRHYWNEIYFEQFGWFPVDLLLASGARYNNFPGVVNTAMSNKDYYFGNLDNNHLTITKGIIKPPQMNPNGKLVHRADALGLIVSHEEYVGNLTSYSSIWSELEVPGIY